MRAFDRIATLRTHYITRTNGVTTDSYFDLEGIELYETRLGWVDKAGRRFYKPDADVQIASYRIRTEFRALYGPLRWDSPSEGTSRFMELRDITEV